MAHPTQSAPLETGCGPVRGHYVPSGVDDVLWGRLPSAADAPVAKVEPGDEVTFDTLSHEGILEDQGRDPRAFFAPYDVPVLADAVALAAADVPRSFTADGPHVVSRPVAVAGARVGDLLAVTVLETLPRVPYGVISNRHGKGALPGEYPLDGAAVFSAFARTDDDGTHGLLPLTPGAEPTVSFPLAPFLGVMGVAVPGDRRPHSVPPGAHGGNLDISLLTVGATLYLPVQVDGALAYVGDPHFAQGNGEVALTAMEASLRATVRLDVIAREDAVAAFGELVGPVAETHEHLVPTGLDPDLDVAVQNCVRSAISLLQARFGMDPSLALAYLSAATDFEVSQVVDRVKGVHARIRKADFPGAA
ncbi:acetamidase/formamidase family protein [Nocardioides sp. cx-173]|uniref:acetamidase/formamidase family protein n=1 Tax=Nocardioides sp. cx-173 TaxID=2898796 RepID=UPI001E3A2FCD|nr:acetamidase/formamidase family protein [Nocardioides sp. cx-173]MCD4525601.1 acetamidase/formamidase family protein [Nocardioides sp. cx-173]UGB42745.1 acetamidase/formamidase family protein [Nocardioides sp. cx-173]